MRRSKVVKRSELPTYWPIGATCLGYLLLDHVHAPGWLWGVAGTVAVVAWFAAGVSIFTDEHVSIFGGRNVG